MARRKTLTKADGMPITNETHSQRVQRIGRAIQDGAQGARDRRGEPGEISGHLKVQAFEMADVEATKEMMDDIHFMLRMLLTRIPA